MEYKNQLLKGTLIKRYKRFMADVALEDGREVTAHCANSGSMYGIKEPGLTVYLSPADNPDRKLKFTWELVEADGGLVGCNTSIPNKLVKEALLEKKVPELTAYDGVKSEVKYGSQNSRIDHLLTQDGLPDCYVEIKNVHMLREERLAEFPDSVTSRGAKHLEELIEMVEAGHRAVMFYLVQRMDCETFSVAKDIDPTYGENFDKAKLAGVEMLCYDTQITVNGIELGKKLDIV